MSNPTQEPRSHFCVRGWKKFQHYQKRNPPWIKLHRSILSDFEFADLPAPDRINLVCIWVLASQLENHIPWRPIWVQGQIGQPDPVNLELYLNTGWITVCECKHCASAALANDDSSALSTESTLRSETETEIEIEPLESDKSDVPASETSKPQLPSEASDNGKPDTAALEALKVAWNTAVAGTPVPAMRGWPSTRRTSANARLRDAEWVKEYPEAIKAMLAIPFYVGQNDRGWAADIDWFLKPKSLMKILEQTAAKTKPRKQPLEKRGSSDMDPELAAEFERRRKSGLGMGQEN